MVPERTLDRLVIKKEQIICLAICLTHYINVEMMLWGSETTILLSHIQGLHRPSPQPDSPFLLSKHLEGCVFKQKTLHMEAPMSY